jgi:SAM-dependent methyltransferase
MQAYNRTFARVYNERWIGFAQRVAPQVLAFYESTPLGREYKTLLDVCCGTGQLALYFLEQGYRVVGIDLSDHMLHYARENAAPYVQSGQARFLRADAADFSLDERFGLAVSTFDSLNHLPDEGALRSCFESVHAALVPGGTLVFDLNTRQGLRTRWNGVLVEDTDAFTIIHRGFYDAESDKAWVKISGFVRTEGGLYERFEQVAFNTAFDLERVRAALLEIGWRSVHFAHIEDLGTPIAEPEQENHAYIVAQK